jgi:uncharacterized protein
MDFFLFAATTAAHVCLLKRANSMGNVTTKKAADPILLLEAAMKGDLETIQAAVVTIPSEDRSAFLNQQDAAGNAAIHGAVFGGHMPVVEYLADHGAALDLPNGLGCSPVWLAAGYNHAAVLEFLLQRRDQSSALLTPNKTGDTPLIAAASKGNQVICKKILEAAAAAEDTGVVAQKLRCAANHSKDTALSVAIGTGMVEDEDILDMLCHPSILNLVNAQGVTPLHVACERDLPVVVQKLIAAGADIDVQDARPVSKKSGCTPLWLATRAGHLECAKLLLAAGANPTLSNNEGLTPLQTAEKFKRLDMVELLTEYEAKL